MDELTRQIFMDGYKAGFEEAYKIGFEIGYRKECRKIAGRLLQMGIGSLQEIVELTSLSLSEVQRLQARLNP